MFRGGGRTGGCLALRQARSKRSVLVGRCWQTSLSRSLRKGTERVPYSSPPTCHLGRLRYSRAGSTRGGSSARLIPAPNRRFGGLSPADGVHLGYDLDLNPAQLGEVPMLGGWFRHQSNPRWSQRSPAVLCGIRRTVC